MTVTDSEMNSLQGSGIVSDNCVHWEDVAEVDRGKALGWLNTQRLEGRVTISIKQPWAWLILHGGKDIENRDWPTRQRGDVLIHASKGMTKSEYAAAFDLFDTIETTGLAAIPTFDELRRGGIVGEVEIVDCVRESDSPWFFGNYGFVLKNPRPLPFLPVNGALGFFKLKLGE